MLGDPAFSNLPRKYKTSISGCLAGCTNHEINDVSFVGVIGPDGTPGYDLWVGGGLSTNPMFGQRLGAFVEPDRVPEVWVGVTSLFREYGYRRSRNHARLKFLVKDWGAARVREVLEKEFLDAPLPDGPAPVRRAHGTPRPRRRVRAERRPGLRGLRAEGRPHRRTPAAHGGRPGRRVRQRVHARHGAAEARDRRRGPARADELVARLDDLDLRARPSAFRKGTMACTGIEFCKLAIGETKGRAQWLYTELEHRLPDFDEDIRIHVNGCPNSCARFQVADIGLMSALQPRPDGTKSDAFLVHLGGTMGSDAAFGRKVKGVKIYAEDAADYVEALLTRYTQRKRDGDTFTSFVNALSAEELARFASPPVVGGVR